MLAVALVAGLLGTAFWAEEPAPEADPRLVIEMPPVALYGVSATITVKPDGELPEGRHAIELRNAAATVLDLEHLESGDSVGLEWVPRREDGALVVLAPSLQSELPVELRTVPGWLTLLPPLVAILLALAFRQVIPALVAGVWVGAWTVAGGPLAGALRTIDTYIVSAMTDSGRASIMTFTLLLGGMVGVISRSGGTIGLVEALRPYATTRRRGQIVTWLMGLFIFFDDYANTLLVGNTMRPVTDRLKISREKLAYIVDSTAAPVASIALVSTWIGYQVSLIGTSLDSIGSDLDPYAVFLQSLPYNFYPILALVFGLMIAASGRDLGPMRAAERRAAEGKLLADTATPLADFDSSSLAPPADKPRRWYNAVAPIAVVVIVTFAGLWITGRASMVDSDYVRGDKGLFQFVGDVFSAADSYAVLLWASTAGGLLALVLSVGQRILSMGEAVAAWVDGIKSMIMAIMILILAWSITDICTALNTRGFLVASLSDTLDPRFLPVLIFLLASVTAFSTGTSWATMGILIPLAVPTVYSLAQNAGFDAETTHRTLLASVSSVLAGAIFGDHCSPISDTTVLSSTASGSDHVDHVRTQLPYALIVAGVAVVFGYVPAGYGISPLLGLVLASVALAAVVRWAAKPV